ncbi:PAS and ANTAR domain-containing protein [Mycolicibacterium sp. GCM10028919]|uniref:PAS and ANTAR domain-containing protein n=1 Tax=Mycolicibacterium sp. GCM10028919 TaxID=3273401 RepID=UPI0036096F78
MRSKDDDLSPLDSNTVDEAPGDLDRALLAGKSQRVGRFQYDYGTDTWTWSDAVARMHGYEPGEVEPTTELMLHHRHPEDVANVTDSLTKTKAPFSGRHRIVTKAGDIRNVVVVGEVVKDDDGDVVATRGFFVDVTSAVKEDVQKGVTDELQNIVAHRAVIDQAKGMLMAIYDISDDAAFEVMRWRSQEMNVKLYDIATELVAQVPGLLAVRDNDQHPINRLLMTLKGDGG